MAAPLGTQLKNHKTELLVGAAGVVVAFALYTRSKSKATSPTPSATSTGTAPGVYYPTSTATTTGNDIYSGLEEQILGLQSAVVGIGSRSSTSSSSTSTPAPTANSTPTAPQFATYQGYDVIGGFTPTGEYTGWNINNGGGVGFTWAGQGNVEVGQAPPAGAKTVTDYALPSTVSTDLGTYTAGPAGWSQGYTGQEKIGTNAKGTG